MKLNSKKLWLAAISSLSLIGVSHSATETDTFTVTATVESACSIVANDLDFGVYNALSAVVPVTSSIDVTCNLGTLYSVGIDAGTGSAGTTTDRRMTGQTHGDELSYSLACLAPGLPALAAEVIALCIGNWGDDRTLLLGDGFSAIGTATGLGLLETHNIPLQGVIPIGQSVSADTYVDTLTATVEF